MTRREKFFKTIKRQMEGYVPFEFELCPSLIKKFKEKTGREDYLDYYDMPYRFIGVTPRERNIDFRKYFDSIDNNITFTEWGMGKVWSGYEHFFKRISPMEKFSTIEEFQNYPYPDPVLDYDWDALPGKIIEIKQKDCITVAAMAMTIFEIAWYLRGMENLMMDMMTEPELAVYHLDRVTAIRCEMARRYAAAGIDILHVGDDVSTQLDMMMSPVTWREFIKPRLKEVIQAAKEVNNEILIDYHGDGNLQKIIPELIEIGVDILNPVQPECMNPVEIKKLYGDKLSFRGTIGTQSTMPFGTPEEVEWVCKEMVEKVGKGGGLILAPTHMLEPEVPWENIEAIVNTIQRYNKDS